jgi:hypothetical protein
LAYPASEAYLSVSGEIGAARADVIEQDCPKLILERRCDEPPHVLVAAEAVGKNHRALAVAADVDIMPNSGLQDRLLEDEFVASTREASTANHCDIKGLNLACTPTSRRTAFGQIRTSLA